MQCKKGTREFIAIVLLPFPLMGKSCFAHFDVPRGNSYIRSYIVSLVVTIVCHATDKT